MKRLLGKSVRRPKYLICLQLNGDPPLNIISSHLHDFFLRYQLMLDCWKEEPNERPTFENTTRLLEEMMQEDTPYLDFESLDESKEYYCSLEKPSDDEVTA